MIFAGIDIGSITTKAAIIKENRIIGTCVILTGYNPVTAGQKVFSALSTQTGIDHQDITAIVATGYGRNSVESADKTMTEIICHGVGAHFLNQQIRGIIDVGGQDSKAIALDAQGQVKNFAMNDKCAAGTGRFLEVMANALEVNLEDLGTISMASKTPSRISSICTVFAESEVISMIAGQKKREDIIAGIHESAAARVASLAARIQLQSPVVMTGGVAKNPGMVKALENRLGIEIMVGDFPQETGAIGAAVMASKINLKI